MSSIEKIYYTYEDIHNLVRKVAKKIKDDNYQPDVMVAVAGGGYIPARILRNEFKKPLVGISMNYYNEKDEIQEKANIYQWVTEEEVRDKKILIIDEVDDTRKTLHYIIENIKQLQPKEIGIAVLNNKMKTKKPFEVDDIRYYCAEENEDKWIVYPWDNY